MMPVVHEAANKSPFPQTFSNSLNWEWLKELPIKISQHNLGKNVTNVCIENTFISFCVSSEAQTWENRITYIKKVVRDINQKCPKDEEIALIDLGCDHLLMAYLFG